MGNANSNSTTKIEWTNATWNPVVGCSKVSAGCNNCYAIRMAWRHQHNPKTGHNYQNTARKMANGETNWTGQINLLEDVLLKPYSWKEPKMIFVNSMSDLFHYDVPFEFIRKVLKTIHENPRHTFQILTKRPERMVQFFNGLNNSNLAVNFPNLWLGVSVEDQQTANERIPSLLQIPSKVRFLSCEPLLGEIKLKNSWLPGINWVIVGGESGPKARPMHPQWVMSILHQCKLASIPFFFKQWGEWAPDTAVYSIEDLEKELIKPGKVQLVKLDGTHYSELLTNGLIPHLYRMCKVGKKAAGRLLGKREYNELPLSK